MPRSFNSLGIDYKAVFKGSNSRMLIGQVKKIHKHDSSRKVECLKLSLDPKLTMYWNARKQFRVVDTTERSKLGDLVLIEQLATPMDHLITHKITEIVNPVGEMIDPITGKPCHRIDYADQTTNSQFKDRWSKAVKEETQV